MTAHVVMAINSSTAMSDALLRRAYERLRKRDWGDFDTALADPVHGRVIRGLAYRLEHPLHAKATVSRTIRLKPLQFDRKRAAAGDKDEQ